MARFFFPPDHCAADDIWHWALHGGSHPQWCRLGTALHCFLQLWPADTGCEPLLTLFVALLSSELYLLLCAAVLYVNFICCCVLLFSTWTLFVVMYCCSVHELYLVLCTVLLFCTWTLFVAVYCCSAHKLYLLLCTAVLYNEPGLYTGTKLCSVHMYADNTRTTLMKSNDKAKITKGSITETVPYVKTLERNSKEEGCRVRF